MKTIIFYLLLVFSCVHLSAEEDSKPSICVIINKYFRGEHEFAERLRIAGERLHWKVKITDLDSFKEADKLYDWSFTLVPEKKNSKKHHDYLILFDPEHHFFKDSGYLKKNYLGYTGYLTTYDDTELLLEDIREFELYPKRWYPTVHFFPYQVVNPTRLFSFIGHWGDRLLDTRYRILQSKLAQTNYANLYGNPALGMPYGTAFKGNIKYDGKSVVNIISQMGVCLVLHSETHLKHSIPSGRIFEAAASSAVIISDLNPFVVKHFGDSVLYIDQELSGEEMFNQVDAHMAWIQSHPEEALIMAKRSYQIFVDKFLLEQQLLDFYEYRNSFNLMFEL